MTDDADIALQGSEDDLRDLLFDQPSLIEEGFRPREREYSTPAGPVDVWGYDDAGHPVILELKRRRSGPDAVSQLRRYIETVDSDARGILVAPSVTDRAKKLIADFDLEYRTVDPPSRGQSTHRSLDEFGKE
jgi:Predicted nuclease of the RecB family